MFNRQWFGVKSDFELECLNLSWLNYQIFTYSMLIVSAIDRVSSELNFLFSFDVNKFVFNECCDG